MFRKIALFFRALPGKIIAFLGKRPAVSFFALIAILFGLIALGTFLRTPKAPEAPLAAEKKETEVFDTATDTAVLSVSAEVKKEGVVNIVALTPGIVSRIYTAPGRTVASGQTLFEITDDYRSGTAVLRREIAINDDVLGKKLKELDKRIYDLTKRQIREKNDTGLIDHKEEDIELNRLKKDRATLVNDTENARLNREIAERNDAVLKPKTFVSGTVEHIRVQPGDLVATGDVLATLRSVRGATTLEALVSRETAALFDPGKPSRLALGTETVEILPTFFSREETADGLYSIVFALSDTLRQRIADGEFIKIELPLRPLEPALALVPIDAVFQDDQRAWVLVEENGRAASKEVRLGTLYGSFAEITDGLESGARVILNRAIIAGDEITVLQ